MKIIGASETNPQPIKNVPIPGGDTPAAQKEESGRLVFQPAETYPKAPAIELKAVPLPVESPDVDMLSSKKETTTPVLALSDNDKREMFGELKSIQEKFEQVRSRLTEQLLNNTRQVAKLSEEISALREVLANLPMSKTSEIPVPDPQLPSIISITREESTQAPKGHSSAALESDQNSAQAAEKKSSSPPNEASDVIKQPNKFLDAVSATAIADEPHERKVAFISKLWDYLNQVAFEIPLHKSDRSN